MSRESNRGEGGGGGGGGECSDTQKVGQCSMIAGDRCRLFQGGSANGAGGGSDGRAQPEQPAEKEMVADQTKQAKRASPPQREVETTATTTAAHEPTTKEPTASTSTPPEGAQALVCLLCAAETRSLRVITTHLASTKHMARTRAALGLGLNSIPLPLPPDVLGSTDVSYNQRNSRTLAAI